jgi:hypothetical protein
LGISGAILNEDDHHCLGALLLMTTTQPASS